MNQNEGECEEKRDRLRFPDWQRMRGND
jgi:hypothetical protein